ncbi:hypothetical protein IC575_010336 [Cucumis melo]
MWRLLNGQGDFARKLKIEGIEHYLSPTFILTNSHLRMLLLKDETPDHSSRIHK